MTPIEPIPETVEAVNELDVSADPGGLLHHLTELSERAQAVVPDLAGVSLTVLEDDVTLTLVGTSEEVAGLDAVQYLAGGPCVAGAEQARELREDDVLDEERWRLFAEASAARGVRSTLTLPIMRGERVAGSVNLYAGSRSAFVDHHEEMAEIFGAWAEGAVANADLSFATRREAELAPQRVRDQTTIDVATGVLASDLGLDVDEADQHLRDAAARAGVSVGELARDIVRAWRQEGRRDEG